MSLADEYDAHLPPQGEIVSGNRWGVGMGSLVGRSRGARGGHGWGATENALTAVPEASSSSERLAGSVKSGHGKGKKTQSAYGSLKSVISGGSGRKKVADAEMFEPIAPVHDDQTPLSPHWAVTVASSNSQHPSITLITTPQASKQLSLDVSSTVANTVTPFKQEAKDDSHIGPVEPKTTVIHRRHTSVPNISHSRSRSATFSLASWIPWARGPHTEAGTSSESTKAEARLKEMLKTAQSAGTGPQKGKIAMRA